MTAERFALQAWSKAEAHLDRDVALRGAAENLSTVYDRRIRADYHETARVSVEEARDALQKAEAFLDLCAREFGFQRERRGGANG